MTSNIMRIGRSVTTNSPPSLEQGELANSEAGSPNGINELFIGINGASILKLLKNTDGNPAEPNRELIDSDTMVGALATNVASAESIVAYIASEIAAAITAGMVYRGGYNATTGLTVIGSKNLDTSPAGVLVGDTYTVTVAGTAFFGVTLEVGDMLLSNQNDPTLVSHWTLVQTNLTPASVKTMYESNVDTNVFDDAAVSKLAGIAPNATVDQTSIVGITGTKAQFDTANSDGNFVFDGDTIDGGTF